MPSLAEAHSHNVPPELFLSHYRTMRDAKRAKDEAGAAFLRASKAATAVGINLKATKLLDKLTEMDADEVDVLLRQVASYSKWTGKPIGTQANMFGDPDVPEVKASAAVAQTEWAASEAGYLAGKGGGLREENPFPEGGPLHVQWDKGFLKGLKLLAANLRLKEDLKAQKADAKAEAKDAKDDAKALGAAVARELDEPAPATTTRRGGRGKRVTHQPDEVSSATH
jgi:hypothetical protein